MSTSSFTRRPPEKPSKLLLQRLKGSTCWLNSLEDIKTNGLKGTFNKSEPASEGKVSMGPSTKSPSNLLPDENEHVCPFVSSINRDTQIEEWESTSRKAAFILD